MATAIDPRICAALGPAYTGQHTALTAELVDTSGSVVATGLTFVESVAGSGVYATNTPTDTAFVGLVYYTWTGTPAIPFLPPDAMRADEPTVSLDMTQVLADGGTVGAALMAARAQGSGKWVVDPIAKTLTLYAPDKTTIAVVFDLDSATAPLSRTPR